ncbi:LPS-assembly protein LptD [Halopseudomonas salegens]|uniref:LPS-assembly protein LptD n=1 Tax=Halopseudomonas salegens TaxID=1434072 RepID=A0A1H2DX92_9GAMM|nr:LPS-assembly protein LptD [Halopseudomonas salegens]SDT87447.1 LPS-assembly protein [Halopseudomonas salegens]
MAYRSPPFALRFPLLLAGSVLLAQPMTTLAQQVDCRASADGQGWDCSPHTATSPLPPRPQRPTAAPQDAAPTATETANTRQPATPAAADTAYRHLDWVSREELSPDMQARIAPYCGGTYVEPPRSGRDDTTAPDQLTVFAEADTGQFAQSQDVGELTGNVLLNRGQLQAESQQASFDRTSNRITLSEEVRLRDRGMLLLADRAELETDTGATRVEGAEYVLHAQHARGTAARIDRREDAVILLNDATYTTCEPGNNAWALHGKEVELNQEEGWGQARNVTLRVKDFPVFYTPYIRFPIDDRRQSGFLVPSISASSNSGSELTVPYYFNLAPNYDATLYPQLLSDRGLLMEGEFRYLTGRSEGQFAAAALDDREKERKEQSKYRSERWMYSWQHQTDITPRLLASVDYTDISDPYYFQDLSTNTGINTGSFLDQRGNLSWRGNNFIAGLNLHAYERATVTDITPYDRLPQVTLDGAVPGMPFGLKASYGSEYVRFERNLMSGFFTDRDGNTGTPDQRWYDDRLTGLTRAEGERVHIEPAISLPLRAEWGYVTPSVKFAYTRYDLSLDGQGRSTLLPDERYQSSQDRSIPIFSLDSGLYFDRQTELFDQGYTQTLEPRLFYLYVPEKDQRDIPIFDTGEIGFSYASLWRDNRFSGKDRIGDANQLSFGLTNRWIQENGIERQRVSIGQALYFSDRKVQLRGIDYRNRATEQSSVSPLALQYQLRFNQDWRLNAELNWDTDQRTTRSGSIAWRYQSAEDPRKIVNLAYRYRKDRLRFDRESGVWTFNPDFGTPGTDSYIANYYKTDQHDVSFMWPVGNNWSLIGRWLRDYGRNQTVDAFGGFEYESCCWKFRVINRYWIDYDETSLNPRQNDQPDRGIFLQVVFKGLGNMTGSNVETLLTDGIPGYRERDNNAF